MSEPQRVNAQDVGNELLDGLGAVFRWLSLVAAIAVGTCLGITLFILVVIDQVSDEMKEDFGPHSFNTGQVIPHSP